MEASTTVRVKQLGTSLGIALAAASAVMAGALEVSARASLAQNAPTSRSRVALTQALPPMDGAHLETTVVEVTYPPGGANATHRHPCPVVGYVLEGALRMQVMGKPEVVYNPGDTFYEAPTDVHQVSANASQDKPARFLAYFVCDHRTPLSVPVPSAPAKGK
jgi:quercetin dioxygenase-like cupin family protein